MMTESFEALLQQPPDVVAAEIRHWAGWHAQRTGNSWPISDYYFHALKKIHMMSEYELLEPSSFAKYLNGLMRIIVLACPEEERAALIENLRLLGKAAPGLAPVELVHRQATGPGAVAGGSGVGVPVPVAGVPAGADLRRFSLLLSRLGGAAGGPVAVAAGAPAAVAAGGPASPRPGAWAGSYPAVLPGLLVAAAAGARKPGELDGLMKRIGETGGVDTRPEQAIRVLAKSLPDWSAENGWEEAISGSLASSHPLEAMHQIVSSAGDPVEGARRFN